MQSAVQSVLTSARPPALAAARPSHAARIIASHRNGPHTQQQLEPASQPAVLQTQHSSVPNPLPLTQPALLACCAPALPALPARPPLLHRSAWCIAALLAAAACLPARRPPHPLTSQTPPTASPPALTATHPPSPIPSSHPTLPARPQPRPPTRLTAPGLCRSARPAARKGTCTRFPSPHHLACPSVSRLALSDVDIARPPAARASR